MNKDSPRKSLLFPPHDCAHLTKDNKGFAAFSNFPEGFTGLSNTITLAALPSSNTQNVAMGLQRESVNSAKAAQR